MQSMTNASTMGMTIGREKCNVRTREDELSRWETPVGGTPRRRFRTRGRGSSRAHDMGTPAKAPMPSELDVAGWSLGEWMDVSGHYHTWYSELVNRFAARRRYLRERFASELVDYAEDYYSSLLEAITAGALGGVIVYAHSNSRGA